MDQNETLTLSQIRVFKKLPSACEACETSPIPFIYSNFKINIPHIIEIYHVFKRFRPILML